MKQKPKLKMALVPSLPVFKNNEPIIIPKKMCKSVFRYI